MQLVQEKAVEREQLREVGKSEALLVRLRSSLTFTRGAQDANAGKREGGASYKSLVEP